jgi:septal ring factor EnvC (AmiA/AmiB activator)
MMSNEWTMKAFLEEHDKRWEKEIAELKAKLAIVEAENEKLEEELENMTEAHNAMYDEKGGIYGI